MSRIDLSQLPEFRRAYPNAQGARASVDQVNIDTRYLHGKRALFVALPGRKTDGHRFLEHAEARGACFAIVKQDYPCPKFKRLKIIPVYDPLHALQALARSHRERLKTPIIGVTGSFGKTLCKDLLHHLLEQTFRVMSSTESYNSQIGVALSLLALEPATQWAVIECGISLPGEMGVLCDMVQPTHTILTHLGREHLATLKSRAAIFKEKSRLLHAVPSSNWCLVPHEVEGLMHKARSEKPANWMNLKGNAPVAPYSISIDPTRGQERCLLDLGGNQLVISIHSTLIRCLATVNMAVRAANLVGLTFQSIAKRLMEFQPEPMRVDLWKTSGGVTVINQPYCGDLSSCGKGLSWARTFNPINGTKAFWFGGMKRKRMSKGQQKSIFDAAQNSDVDRVYFAPKGTQGKTLSHLSATSQELRGGDLLIVQGSHKLPRTLLAHQLQSPLPPARLHIDLAAIEHNIAQFRRCLPKATKIMAMLKAAAYGTDSELMAKFLAKGQVQSFGLATIEEAISLRRAGIAHPLMVLHAEQGQYTLALKWGLELCVSSQQELKALIRAAKAQGRVLPLHLHIDTGMCRLGCSKRFAAALAMRIERDPNVDLKGVMTHLAGADAIAHTDFSRDQVTSFREILEQLRHRGLNPQNVHLANSAGALRYHRSPFNLLRLGLSLYGLHPHQEDRKRLDLLPAISLTAKIAFIHRISRGESVSYGRTYTAKRPKEAIAVIPLGYADGLHSSYSGKGAILVRGKSAPLVGKICMDFCMVDITEIPLARVGDEGLFFGEDKLGNRLDALGLAAQLGTSPHELITSLGSRIQRIFTYDESAKPNVASFDEASKT